MQLALELKETTIAENRTDEARPVERLVSQPWLDYEMPRWWRLRQLFLAAQEYGQSLIIYRSGEYGPSILRSREAKDRFYREHEKAAINA